MEAVPTQSLGFAVCRALVLTSVPPTELVYVGGGSSWQLMLVNKDQVPGWRAVLEATLSLADEAPSAASAELLATDLTRILVDPSPSRGLTVSERGAIPANDESSDVRRDLERAGLDEVAIVTRLREGVPSTLRAPEFRAAKNGVALHFFTWGFYGGELVEWNIPFGATGRVARIERSTLARYVGSFDFYG